MANLTRGEVLTAVEDLERIKRSIDIVRANRWFNNLEDLLNIERGELDPMRYFISVDLGSVKSGDTYVLPDDIESFDSDELGFWKVDSKGEKIERVDQNIELEKKGYYIKGDTVYFKTSGKIKFYYNALFSRKTSYESTDEIILDERFNEMAITYIAVQYFDDEEEIENKVEYSGKFEEMFDNWKKRNKRFDTGFNFSQVPLNTY